MNYLEQACQSAFLQFVYEPARKMRDFKGNIPFGAGFPIGASSILLAHDFALQSLVCYTFCDR